MESGGDYWDLAAFNQPTASFNEEAHHMMMYQGSSHHLLSAAGHRFPAVDPHLTCLKLGKRHYFEDVGERHHHHHLHHLHHHQQQQEQQHVAGFKRGRGEGGPSSSSPSSVPKCQVEGCNVPLLNAKDYHRRHKVCEMHSKAPKVVVLGVEQRFCQQCSRFHVLSEFDDSKRSCRRRLAGHNERRRKSSNDAVARNPSQESKAMDGRFPCISASSRGRAHSLLSSKGSSSSWVSPSDLSSRSSAALQELIAENRAAVLARQLFAERSWQHVASEEMSRAQELSTYGSHQRQMVAEVPRWTQIQEPSLHVTLDLMQAQASSYGGILSGRSKSKEEDECSELWKSLAGTHVV